MTRNLVTCENIIEASEIENRLKSAGINCILTNQNFTTLMPLYNNMLGSGIQILVNENDYDIARALIPDKINPNQCKLTCPNCGSSKITLGIGKKKTLKIFNIIISLLYLMPMGNLKPGYYCKECKTEF